MKLPTLLCTCESWSDPTIPCSKLQSINKPFNINSEYCNILILFRSLLNNGRSNSQAWGLIVLLLSKAAGHKLVDDIELDKAAGVLHR
jgi:hypothetical protein